MADIAAEPHRGPAGRQKMRDERAGCRLAIRAVTATILGVSAILHTASANNSTSPSTGTSAARAALYSRVRLRVGERHTGA